MVERRDVPPHVLFVLPVRDVIHTRARVFPQTLKGCHQRGWCEQMRKREKSRRLACLGQFR